MTINEGIYVLLRSLISQGRENIAELSGNVFGTSSLPTSKDEFDQLKTDTLTMYINIASSQISQERSDNQIEIIHDIKMIVGLPVQASDERSEAAHDYLQRFQHVVNKNYWGFKPVDPDCGCINARYGLVPTGNETIKKINGILYHLYNFKLTEYINRSQYKTLKPLELHYHFATPICC